MKRTNIRIAVQKEGRLRSPSLEFLASLGLQFPKDNGRVLIVPCLNADVEILYVRHRDVPQYVQSGVADFAIVGGNVLYENDFNVQEVKKLNFGACSLTIAVPVVSPVRCMDELDGERIATSYPNSLRKLLQRQRINAAIVEIKGAVEVTTALGLADAICDLVQTGKTLQENALRPIGAFFDSTAVCIESPFMSDRKDVFINTYLTKAL